MATNQTSEERRIGLDSKLRALLGNNNTYFQPPETVKLKYDCIIYSLSGVSTKRADNKNYDNIRKYDLLHIHRDPDKDLIDEIAEAFIYAAFDRRYISDNLYHDAYTIYY